MTVRELLDLLENYVDDDAEVLMATQRSRPLQFTISHVYDTEDARMALSSIWWRADIPTRDRMPLGRCSRGTLMVSTGPQVRVACGLLWIINCMGTREVFVEQTETRTCGHLVPGAMVAIPEQLQISTWSHLHGDTVQLACAACVVATQARMALIEVVWDDWMNGGNS